MSGVSMTGSGLMQEAGNRCTWRPTPETWHLTWRLTPGPDTVFVKIVINSDPCGLAFFLACAKRHRSGLGETIQIAFANKESKSCVARLNLRVAWAHAT